ncbi:MAG: DUF932 domain-containing protein [Patescibacteria group bacterium]|nr:DUF932 domain-containing protein [Patescibacteria group bacterium]
MQASHQWATRPADQRFTSLINLADHCEQMKQISRGKVVPSKAIKLVPVDNPEHKGLVVVGPNGAPAAPTNWSFGQLCQRAASPAGFLRELPAELVADVLNYRLHVERPVEDLGVLLTMPPTAKVNGQAAELRAVTGPNYGRVWNSTIARSLVDRFGDGITGHFRVPGEFGKRVEVTKDNTTIYASDRDMFVFLADEDRRIEVPGRRDGKSGSLARGFFIWNSEVGAQTFGIAFFLFDYVCCNRIVWGAEGYQEIRIRHTVSGPHRWVSEVEPAIEHFTKGSDRPVVALIESAQQKKVEDLDKFLQNRFTKPQASAIKAAFQSDEQRDIETLWDVTTAVTAYARGLPYQDERVKLEREGGKILALAK